MEINIDINSFLFDGAGFANAIRSCVASGVNRAARAFFDELAARVPVYTGFLRGSFDTLGAAVGGSAGPQGVQGEYYYPYPVGGNRGRRRGIRRGNPVLKTNTSGQQFTTQTQNIITSTSEPIGWKFTYEVDIRYFAVRDIRWDSWRSAIKAFNAIFDVEMQNLPAFTTFLKMIRGTVPSQTMPYLEGITSLDIKSY